MKLDWRSLVQACAVGAGLSVLAAITAAQPVTQGTEAALV